MVWGDSRTLHLLCTLFVLLLHLLHLRSSGMGSQMLRTPALELTSKSGFCFMFIPNLQGLFHNISIGCVLKIPLLLWPLVGMRLGFHIIKNYET